MVRKTREQVWRELDELGEDEVRERLAASPDEGDTRLAREWLARKERVASELSATAAEAAPALSPRGARGRPSLAVVGGVAMASGTLTGAIGSKYVSERGLLIVFAVMVTVAFVVMLLPEPLPDVAEPAAVKEYSASLTAATTAAVGLAAGLVGAGGAFLLVPLLLVVVGVPIRVTIGSSLAITAVAATAGVLGKALTGQIPVPAVFLVAAGALLGAQLGAASSRRLSGVALKRVLLVVIALTGARVWWDVLARVR